MNQNKMVRTAEAGNLLDRHSGVEPEDAIRTGTADGLAERADSSRIVSART